MNYDYLKECYRRFCRKSNIKHIKLVTCNSLMNQLSISCYFFAIYLVFINLFAYIQSHQCNLLIKIEILRRFMTWLKTHMNRNDVESKINEIECFSFHSSFDVRYRHQKTLDRFNHLFLSSVFRFLIVWIIKMNIYREVWNKTFNDASNHLHYRCITISNSNDAYDAIHLLHRVKWYDAMQKVVIIVCTMMQMILYIVRIIV